MNEKLKELALLKEKSKPNSDLYLEEINKTCINIEIINNKLTVQSMGAKSSIDHHSDVNQ